MTTPQGPGRTPAGWYPDPSGSGQQRYWDGSQWTDQYAPGAGTAPAQQPGGAPAPARPAGPPPNLWWAVPALALIAAIGSAGKWVSASVGGTELASETGLGGGDGWFTLITVLIATGLMVAWRQSRQRGIAIGAAVLAAIGALIPLIYVIDPASGVEGGLGDVVDYGRGWGLWLSFVGAGALTVVSILLALRREEI
jgi:hypothetical protein